MVGFRQTRNIASVPFRSNIGGIGFRDATNYFNLSPITAGPLVTSYTDLSNYVPSYTPPPPPAASVYTGDDGGIGESITGPESYQIGNTGRWSPDVAPSGWGDSQEAVEGAYDDEMGDQDQGTNTNTEDSMLGEEWDGDEAWSHGGTIPPMYANQGEVMPTLEQLAEIERQRQESLGTKQAQTKPSEISGGILGDFRDLFSLGIPDNREPFETTRDLVKQATENPKEAVDSLLGKAITPASMIAWAAGLPPIAGAYALEKIYDVASDIGKNSREAKERKANYEEYITNIAGNPVAAAEAAVGDYGVDDTIDQPYSFEQEVEDEIQSISNNAGAIYGDYSPPSVNLSRTDPANYNMKDSQALLDQLEKEEKETRSNIPSLTIPSDFSVPVGPITVGFAPPSSSTITGTPTYNDFVAKTPNEYQEIIDSIDNVLDQLNRHTGGVGIADTGDDGSGWADGGSYNDDGTDFGTNEYSGGQSTTGDAFADAMSDTDQFGLSRGGHIYASKGGYVNSVGGK